MSKDDVRIFAKQLLIFSVAVDYSGGWWVYHATDIVYEFEDEASLSAASGTRQERRERVAER